MPDLRPPTIDALELDQGILAAEQRADPDIGPIIQAVQNKTRPTTAEKKLLPPGARVLLRHYGQLLVSSGVLYKATNSNSHPSQLAVYCLLSCPRQIGPSRERPHLPTPTATVLLALHVGLCRGGSKIL